MSSVDIKSRELKLLLVEDNADDAFLLERHLRRHGFQPQITRVETSPAMLEALAGSDTPDVVLADYNLPNFSGPAALQLLRKSGLDIPFLMMSGAVSEETAVESMRAGAHDYVSKQNLTRLVPALERELKEASGRRNKLAAEEALRASEARFHRLVEAMPLGLLISEASGRIIYANQAVERLRYRGLRTIHQPDNG
jgi:DNA-binding NtrC family response regulator